MASDSRGIGIGIGIDGESSQLVALFLAALPSPIGVADADNL